MSVRATDAQGDDLRCATLAHYMVTVVLDISTLCIGMCIEANVIVHVQVETRNYTQRDVCVYVPCIFVNDTTREATSPRGSRASMAMWWSTPLLAHNPKSMTDGNKRLAIKFNPTPTSIRCPTLRTATEAT